MFVVMIDVGVVDWCVDFLVFRLNYFLVDLCVDGSVYWFGYCVDWCVVVIVVVVVFM